MKLPLVLSLKIDSYIVPIATADGLTQIYQWLNENPVQRKMNGTGYMQRNWGGKLRTVIEGQGRLPDGLVSLGAEDPRIPHLISCFEPMELHTTSTSILLPAANRRVDMYEFTPIGYGISQDGNLIQTKATIVGDNITLTAVAGATAYKLMYWPVLYAFIISIQHTGDAKKNVFGWRITAEQT